MKKKSKPAAKTVQSVRKYVEIPGTDAFLANPRTLKDADTVMIKTTLRLPRNLWIEAKHVAIDQGIEFQHLVAAGIAGYLEAVKKAAADPIIVKPVRKEAR